MLTNVQAAWLAGYIDGDGSIGMYLPTSPRVSTRWRYPEITISSSDLELLLAVETLIGGMHYPKKGVSVRQAWHWRLKGAPRVIPVLEMILPYLRCQFKLSRTEMLVNEYRLLTTANGFYTLEMREAKKEFESRFLALGKGRGARCLQSGATVMKPFG